MAQTTTVANGLFSATIAVSVISNSLTLYDRSRGVYIGVSQSLDFSFDGVTWLTFSGLAGGTVLPIQVIGARKTSGAASPTAGDVIFLY